MLIFLLLNWYLAHIQIHQLISLVVVQTEGTLVLLILCMMYGHVAMFEIGRWAKNELKQVDSAVDSCSSSYFPASRMNTSKILHHCTCTPAAWQIAIIRLLHCMTYDAMTPGLKLEDDQNITWNWTKQGSIYTHLPILWRISCILQYIAGNLAEICLWQCPRCFLIYYVWNNMIMIPIVKIGRWSKNYIKQVHSAVYSCSSSGILLIFRYISSYPLW